MSEAFSSHVPYQLILLKFAFLLISILIRMYATLIKSVDDATFQLILRHLFVRGFDHNLRETGQRYLTQSYD